MKKVCYAFVSIVGMATHTLYPKPAALTTQAQRIFDRAEQFLATDYARAWEESLTQKKHSTILNQMRASCGQYKKPTPAYKEAIQDALRNANIDDTTVLITAMTPSCPYYGTMAACAMSGRVIAIDEHQAHTMPEELQRHIFQHEALHVRYKDPLSDDVIAAIVTLESMNKSQQKPYDPAHYKSLAHYFIANNTVTITDEALFKELQRPHQQPMMAEQCMGRAQFHTLVDSINAHHEYRVENGAALTSQCCLCTHHLGSILKTRESNHPHEQECNKIRSSLGYFLSSDFFDVAKNLFHCKKQCAYHSRLCSQLRDVLSKRISSPLSAIPSSI